MEKNNKIRILCITRAYSQTSGGMERLSYEMIESLKADPSFNVEVIAHQGERLSSLWFVIKNIPRVLFKARKADIIHLGDPLLSKLGWLIKVFYKKPVVITVHGLDVLYPNIFYRLYLHLFFRNFDSYIAISQYVKDILSHQLPSQRIQVITPGISDEYYDQTRTRQELELVIHQSGESKKVLLTVGRLVKRKGHAWFIKHVLPQLPENVLYVIAGKGPEEERIRKTAQKTGLQDRVILLGKVSTDTLKVLYNTVDAFIQPNISVKHDAEGFGLVLLEAALCQRPIFASRLEGIPDAIQDGKNGTLLPTEDAAAWSKALELFLQQPTQVSLSAREYTLEKFSWSSRLPDYQSIFTALCK